MAFVGPSGGGKSTLANLVCRFFDVQSGSVRVGGADVRAIPKEERMDTISFVFQNSRLLKGSILDNVRLGRPQATEAEVLAALKAAQCMDIVEKFPAGIHTVIGTKGVYLSGDKIEYNKATHKITATQVHPSDYIEWTKGNIYFEKESLENIMKTLSRIYDVEIRFDSNKLPNEYFTGTIPGGGIQNALNILMLTSPFYYEMDGSVIVLKEK